MTIEKSTSKFGTLYPKSVLVAAVATSSSIKEVLTVLGISYVAGSIRSYIKRLINKYSIDTSHFQIPPTNPHSDKTKLGWEQRLFDNQSLTARVNTKILRRALLDFGRKHQCEKCFISPEWRGEPLRLEIDHINGDWKDNRPENLRFLCPNCHSQETCKQATAKRVVVSCSVVGCNRNRSVKRRVCQPLWKCPSCVMDSRMKRQPIGWPTDSELKDLVWKASLWALSKSLGVSDRALRKRCKKRGVLTPPRGYWQKKQFGKL